MRHGRAAGSDLVEAHAMRIADQAFGAQLAVVIRFQFHCFKAVMTAIWAEVHFPLGPCLIASGGQHVRHRLVIGEWGQLAFITHTADRMAVFTGHDRGAGRHTDWTIAIRMSECDALITELIELWRENLLIPKAAMVSKRC